MNSELLLTSFDRVSDAPNAIPRLRAFMFALAARGKLVERNSSDAPTSDLLECIQGQRTWLENKGKIRKLGILPRVDPNTVPFPVPEHWRWLQLRGIGTLSGGMTPSMSRPEFWDGRINWFSPKDFKNGLLSNSELKVTNLAVSETRLQVYRPGCLFMVARSGILKRTFPVAINTVPATANQDLKVLTPFVDGLQRYLQIILWGITDFILSHLVKTGTTVQSLKYEEFELLPVPLAPLAEQQRIVAKIDQLMSLCDELEAKGRERGDRMKRLTAASLHHLSNGESTEASRQHARFYINHISELTVRPEQIPPLREAIRNLAIRGRLVPQNPDDEPASELLTRMSVAKDRLMKEGKIKNERPLPPISASLIPFELPKGWSWTRLGSLSQLVTSGSRDWAKFYSSDGAIFVRMGNLSRHSYRLRLENIQRVQAPIDSEGARTKLEEGDILISITGEVGLLGLIPKGFGEAYINQHTCLVRPMEQIRNRYLPELFLSPFAQGQFDEPQRGLKNSFRLTDVTQFLVPLPPLAEQCRIVAKIDELMMICDKLEAQLTITKTESTRFLNSVLDHVIDAMATNAPSPSTVLAARGTLS